MLRNVARVAAIALLTLIGVVACGDDHQACAASLVGNPPPKPPAAKPPAAKPPQVNQPGQQRTTSKVQDTKPAATSRPTSWSGYDDRVKDKNWKKPYRRGYPTPQKPVIINQYGHDYRTYPGYVGYYPIGVWPIGYGDEYGCVADREGQPVGTPPTPAPTVTVTAPPEGSSTPSVTPSETPR